MRMVCINNRDRMAARRQPLFYTLCCECGGSHNHNRGHHIPYCGDPFHNDLSHSMVHDGMGHMHGHSHHGDGHKGHMRARVLRACKRTPAA